MAGPAREAMERGSSQARSGDAEPVPFSHNAPRARSRCAGLQTVLATGGAGAVVAGGLVARARSAAQLWATRLRQDVYTDLVSADITVLPTLPRGSRRQPSRQRRALVESAVRQRGLTPATAVPDTGG